MKKPCKCRDGRMARQERERQRAAAAERDRARTLSSLFRKEM